MKQSYYHQLLPVLANIKKNKVHVVHFYMFIVMLQLWYALKVIIMLPRNFKAFHPEVLQKEN